MKISLAVRTSINPALRSRRGQILRRRRFLALRARNRVANDYILRRHLNFFLGRQINVLKQFFYGRHMYLLNHLSRLFLTLPHFFLFQALIGRKVGFQNLRLNFARRSLQAFVLAKKDWHYLKSYGISTGPYFESLFSGGYNFFSYQLSDGAFSRFVFDAAPRGFFLTELNHVRLVPLVFQWYHKTFLPHQFHILFSNYGTRVSRGSLSALEIIKPPRSFGMHAELTLWFSYYLVIQLNKLLRHRLRLLGSKLKEKFSNHANS